MSKDLLRNPTSRTPAILQKSGFAGKQDAIAGRRPGVRSVLTAATAEQLVAIRSAEPGEQVLLAGWGANRWTNDQTKELKNDMECAATALANMPVKLLEQAAMTQSPRLRLFGGAA